MKNKALLSFGLFLIAVFLASPPHDLPGKACFVASGICHRLPDHSLFFGGRQSPLCARCTGTYLGLFLAVLFLMAKGKLKCGLFPPFKVSLIMAGFLLLWGIDGLNSFADFWRGEPLLYPPANWLRLATGFFYGLCWGGWFVPIFNSLMFRNPYPCRSVENFWELAFLASLGAGLVGLVGKEWPFLFYPTAFLSLVGPLLLLGAINALLLKLAFNLHPDGVEEGREIFPLYLAGIGLSLVEILAINLVRLKGGF